MNDFTAIVLDTETTGLIEPRPVEIAYCGIDEEFLNGIDNLDMHVFHSRFNPGKPIEFGAMATHHLTDVDVAEAPDAATFKLPDGTEFIIAHNVDFDWECIGKPNVKRICTLAMSRYLFPLAESHKLTAMLYRMDMPFARTFAKSAHGAYMDTLMCKHLLGLLITELRNRLNEFPVDSGFDVLWNISEKARVPTIMAFGKHKGMSIEQMKRHERGYVSWLLNQTDLDPYLQKALRS